ncbi:pimeloyl-ACP methyl ester carboxylesterase [Cupriavidus metallidurans]|nr:alpha/beta fold hydrolase [Cupriavidus metallidurans]MDE4920655.1 alpha/beta fold hydrolase [Cupriavidus metallidurans]
MTSPISTTTPRPETPDEILERFSARAIVHRDRSGPTEMVWREIGRGSPLVLIHGGHGNWMHWVRNIEALSQQHTLWLPDLPGFGESGTLDGDPHADDRLDRLVDTVAASLRQRFGASDGFALAGFSFGGVVAARLAAALPNVEKLALLGSAGHGGMRRQRLDMVNWRTEDREQMLQGLRHNLKALMLHDPSSIDALAMAVHERACMATRFRSKSISRGGPVLGQALDSYGGKTLLIWGEHDVTADPLEVAPRIAGNLSTRRWHLVPGGGHWVQYERADEINQLLLQWFARADGGLHAR